ncbi:MAG TPA: ABC transporter permease [Nitrospira sp.]|jgi:lipopolysaccharide transport system permease protein|nr:ABC transporter permease [Nitrospira sp.]
METLTAIRWSLGLNVARGAYEMLGALKLRDTWAYCGWQDIRLRYRRSILGPWWLTASTAVTIGVLGVLWSQIFQLDIQEYLPFYAIGYVVWTWFAAQINDACSGFTQFEHIIKQTRLPYPTYLLRLAMRNLLILGHHAVVVVAVLMLCHVGWHAVSWLSIVGLALVTLVSVLLSIVVAICCARYRDLPPVVGSLLQVMFFLTPILWQPGALRSYAWVVNVNPLFHWIEVIRLPLLGRWPDATSYGWTAGSIVVLGLSALWLLGRQRDRIAYWM